MTKSQQRWLNNATYSELVDFFQNAYLGHPMLSGVCGYYFRGVMAMKNPNPRY